MGIVLASIFLFLCCGTSSDNFTPTFDGDQAYQYLVRQCEFGPRVPGSEAHGQCLNFLIEELQEFGAQVTPQLFSKRLPGYETPIKLTNVIASFGLQKSERILLCAHWDTRPWADQDPDPDNHSEPIIGANDGASGVAVLLEVA